ncbi:unnamed protein product [Cuscuta epithymum]|uniref:Uncharacterized protein n=1 Tax=Cuscuta epithymum TaxID=186058 RepID=A0AAV0D3R4_9ASTE|nr:unnamed protein product [Cuscuta epithymum]
MEGRITQIGRKLEERMTEIERKFDRYQKESNAKFEELRAKMKAGFVEIKKQKKDRSRNRSHSSSASHRTSHHHQSRETTSSEESDKQGFSRRPGDQSRSSRHHPLSHMESQTKSRTSSHSSKSRTSSQNPSHNPSRRSLSTDKVRSSPPFPRSQGESRTVSCNLRSRKVSSGSYQVAPLSSQADSSRTMVFTRAEDSSSQLLSKSPESQRELVNQEQTYKEDTTTDSEEESNEESSINLGLEAEPIIRPLTCHNPSSLNNVSKEWNSFRENELPSSDRQGWNQGSVADALGERTDFVFSSARCCLVSVLLHTSKDYAKLKIVWVFRLSVSTNRVKMDFPLEEHAVAKIIWWNILKGDIWLKDSSKCLAKDEGGCQSCDSCCLKGKKEIAEFPSGSCISIVGTAADALIAWSEATETQGLDLCAEARATSKWKIEQKVMNEDQYQQEQNHLNSMDALKREDLVLFLLEVWMNIHAWKLLDQPTVMYWEGRGARKKRKKQKIVAFSYYPP